MDSRLLHCAGPPWHHQVSGLLHPAPKKLSPAYKPHQKSQTRKTRKRQASSPLAIDKLCPHPDVIRCHKVYHVILFKLYNSGRYQGHKLRVEVTCSPLFSRSLFFQEQHHLEWYGFFLFRQLRLSVIEELFLVITVFNKCSSYLEVGSIVFLRTLAPIRPQSILFFSKSIITLF